MEEKKIISYKGFEEDLKCRGFQYEIGKEYEVRRAELCSAGFHACENPIDVFNYYNMVDSRFCIVEQYGDIDKSMYDTKMASTKIKIVKEVSLEDLVYIICNWFFNMIYKCNETPLEEKSITVLKGEEQSYANRLHGENIVQHGRFNKLAILFNKVMIKSHGVQNNIALCGNYANIYTDGNCTNISSNGDKANICSYGNLDSIVCSGKKSNICSFGEGTYIHTKGPDSNVISVGLRSDIISMGEYCTIMSSGNFSEITSYKQVCKIVSKGEGTNIKSFGFKSTIQSRGLKAKILIGGEGTFVKAKDGTEITIIRRDMFCDDIKDKYETFIVGQDGIKEDVWYEFDGEDLVEQ